MMQAPQSMPPELAEVKSGEAAEVSPDGAGAKSLAARKDSREIEVSLLTEEGTGRTRWVWRSS